MPELPAKQEQKLQLWGWVLFVICALLFLGSSIRNRDTLAIYGSLIFLTACFVFMYPLIKALRAKNK